MATPRKGPKPPVSPRSTADVNPEPVPAASADLVAIVRGLAAAVADHGLSELVVDTPDATFTLRRGGTVVAAMPIPAAPSLSPSTLSGHSMPSHAPPFAAAYAPSPAPAAEEPVEEKGHVVTSPFVGTFYSRPNPDSPEYVRLNDRVKKNQVLCIIEAMKLMNEIEADIDGRLVGVLAEDGAPVEYGQPLFKIAPG